MREPRTWVALVAIGIAAAVPVAAARHGQAGARAAEALAVRGLGRAIEEQIDGQARAVAALAERFGGWEAMPAEAVERALAETAAAFPAFRALCLVGRDGRIVAAARGAGGAALAPGADDGSAPRRAAMTAALAGRGSSAAWVSATHDRIEIAAPVRRPGGGDAGAVYVAGDVDTRGLEAFLAETEKQTGATLGLEARGVVYPKGRPAPSGGRASDLGHGLTLRVVFPGAGARTLALAAAVGLLLSATLLLATRRPKE